MVEFATETALAHNESVIVDATFNDARTRAQFITLAKDQGAEAVGLYFEVPFDVAYERNIAREKQVPKEIVIRMHNRLKQDPPALTEGFATLYTVNEQCEIIAEQKAQMPQEFKMR